MKPLEEFYRIEAIRHLLKLGYPKENFKIEAVVKRFGNAGRNAMRADFAVLDISLASLASGDVDELLEHAVLLCEVKRESSGHNYVKTTQVKPLLDFAKLDRCIALYWDNVDQRIFWHERKEGRKYVREGSLPLLPRFGRDVKAVALKYSDTKPSESLTEVFDRIDDMLHADSIDPEQRYQVMLQVLLAKLYDEHAHASAPANEPDIQDYAALGLDGRAALSSFNAVLAKAVGFYQVHLPQTLPKHLLKNVSESTILEIGKLIAPIRLIASKRDVVQAFYMKFARGLYKWDLAQFFTPPTVTDFIIDVLNPQFGEHIKDPACGSADFLIAAYHKRRDVDPGYASCIWGVDNSKNAVQVGVLNMLLNGDGKTNIREGDSLAKVDQELDRYDILVCNPPFGLKIVEKNPATLRRFDLGYLWEKNAEGILQKIDSLLPKVETGLLFAEVCVKQVKPGGRIGIILPNGYLGNRSARYVGFREWLLRHCRLAAIHSFPRFTFKTSGADVSASVVFLEKRDEPLKNAADSESYSFNVELVERVGWSVGDNRADPEYIRGETDGAYQLDADGRKMLDCDFPQVLDDMRRSDAAANDFPWMQSGAPAAPGKKGWSISIARITADADLTLDPKRHSRKVHNLIQSIESQPHFVLGDCVTFVKELHTSADLPIELRETELYQYIEIDGMKMGEFTAQRLRGWQLPSRARHLAEPTELYCGQIWGSVRKWCLTPDIVANLIVTNGCHRLRLKPSQAHRLIDLIAFFCSEAYVIQMRAMARGSDGLAEIIEGDMGRLVVPELTDREKADLAPFVAALRAGTPTLKAKVDRMIDGGSSIPNCPARHHHAVLV